MGARNAVAKTTGNPLKRLTEKQKAFVEQVVLKGQKQTMAARLVGYTHPEVEGTRLMQNPIVQDAIRYLHRRHEKASDMTRKQVMDGFKEAIDMAKLQSEPGVMVAGWREVARMCGYYAPEKKVIDVNYTAKRVVDKLETLSDAELQELIEEDTEAIEGEFTEILETTQEMADAEHAAAGYDG